MSTLQNSVFSIDRNKGHIFDLKSVIIWRYRPDKTGSCVYSPIAYIRKPKGVSDEDFNNLINRIKINNY